MVDQIDVALLTFLGQLVGSIGAGSSSDLLGRKWTFQITMIIWGDAGILAAFAWNVWALMFFRFLIGVGGEAPVAQAMMSEFVPADKRAKYIAIMEGFWAVGFVLSGAFDRGGLRFGGGASFDSGYRLHFAPHAQVVTLQQQQLCAVAGLDRPFTLEVMLWDDIIDLCIDGRRTLLDRCPQRRGAAVMVYAEDAAVMFELAAVTALAERDEPPGG